MSHDVTEIPVMSNDVTEIAKMSSGVKEEFYTTVVTPL